MINALETNLIIHQNQNMQKRVKFDFEIYFTNGGNIKGEDFRLDIQGDTISDRELTDYIVADLRLLMVGRTKILNKEIIEEPHKRKPVNKKNEKDLLIDLSHTIQNGLITYKGLPAPIICDYLSREGSKQLYEEGTEFQIGKIEMVSNTGTYVDCPFHRFENGNRTRYSRRNRLTGSGLSSSPTPAACPTNNARH